MRGSCSPPTGATHAWRPIISPRCASAGRLGPDGGRRFRSARGRGSRSPSLAALMRRPVSRRSGPPVPGPKTPMSRRVLTGRGIARDAGPSGCPGASRRVGTIGRHPWPPLSPLPPCRETRPVGPRRRPVRAGGRIAGIRLGPSAPAKGCPRPNAIIHWRHFRVGQTESTKLDYTTLLIRSRGLALDGLDVRLHPLEPERVIELSLGR